MKLQFKHQLFQAQAAQAVCDVFAGQPHRAPATIAAEEDAALQTQLYAHVVGNHPLVPELSDARLLDNLRRVQRRHQLPPSPALEGLNLTVEMETGVGKTYTYIKTMYELHQRYGWCKFIVVVPSVAVREGVLKTFAVTREHFAEEYGQKIRCFAYNSERLFELDRFASDNALCAMIINAQAFNARSQNARRISMQQDSFGSRRPIDVVAATHPILIIDEPQSVEGKATRERLRDFGALLTLRYSATHKKGHEYNMVYRLDAMEAYNKRLVKKIAVKGVSVTGGAATGGYLYLQGLTLSAHSAPAALLEFEVKGAHGVRKTTRSIRESDHLNLFEASRGLEQYRHGYTLTRVDARDGVVHFLNGTSLRTGEVRGAVGEGHLRRIQIRETILSHLEREERLYAAGIKTLSLFFIDEVAKYRRYDTNGTAQPGEYAALFEQEYHAAVQHLQTSLHNKAYLTYLERIRANATHAGYFSIDHNRRTGKTRFVDSKPERGSTLSADRDAYDLIMKDKERLLDLDEPVRFLFSHSALREGWDNPNVFQICTLKQSGSDVRKRQEVGRGLRLAVNQSGERMDAAALGADVHDVNVLTVVANESYDAFTRALQTELAEVVADRPQRVDMNLFTGRELRDAAGTPRLVDEELALALYDALRDEGYVHSGRLTDDYYRAREAGTLRFAGEVADYAESLVTLLDSVCHLERLLPVDARRPAVPVHVNRVPYECQEFQALWQLLRARTAYVVDFDEARLLRAAADRLDRELSVPAVVVRIDHGELDAIPSREALQNAAAFRRTAVRRETLAADHTPSAAYDLVGKLVDETGLTRAAVAAILQRMAPAKFALFRDNPEEFILRAAALINAEKASAIVEHITYRRLERDHPDDLLIRAPGQVQPGVDALPCAKHILDHVRIDSESERDFVRLLDAADAVAAYAKLPRSFFIATPLGRYTPDWAIAFRKNSVKHLFFVAETKGSSVAEQLRLVENAKIHCARQHFKAIGGEHIQFDAFSSFEALMDAAER